MEHTSDGANVEVYSVKDGSDEIFLGYESSYIPGRPWASCTTIREPPVLMDW